MFLVLIAYTYNFKFHIAKAGDITRFRLGASVPFNVVRGFGVRHGVTISPGYDGGRRFYDYMTKGPGFFSYIDLAIDLSHYWARASEMEFLRGMLDKADEEGSKVEISAKVYGVDLGWPGWEPYLYMLLEKIGPNRASMRYIFLCGEWSYMNKQPPNWDDLYTDFQKAKQIVNSYGYELGWSGEGKYRTNIPWEYRDDMLLLGPRKMEYQITRDPDCAAGALDCYRRAKTKWGPNDVFLEAFTMWDREANIPNSPPYYICYDKFKEFVHGAADLFDELNGTYPQAVVFEIMPETFNDVEGVECPYLQWWREYAEIYDLMIFDNAVKVREPLSIPPPEPPFPPYPTGVVYVNNYENLIPFCAKAGGTFKGHIEAKNEYTGALRYREVEVYLIKPTPATGKPPWFPIPITKEQWANMSLMGTALTDRLGVAEFELPAPSEPGFYLVLAHLPKSEQEMESFSGVGEGIWVAEKAHRVEVRSNVKVKLDCGPTAYGWSGSAHVRWVEPGKPVIGNCAEGEWKFIVPERVVDGQGKTWVFSHWEDGSINPARVISVDKDLALEAYYLEPGAKSKLDVYGYVRDDRNYPLAGAFVAVSSPIDQVSTTTDSHGKYTVTLSINGPGDSIGVIATHHRRSGSASKSVPSSTSSMQIDVTVPRTSTSISVSVSPTSVLKGESATVSGVISPAVQGATVTLRYMKPDATTVNRTVWTSSSGSFLDSFTTDQCGTYSVVASWLGNDDYKGSSSETKSFTATKQLSTISISLNTTSMVIGQAISVSGVIDQVHAGVCVDLEYRRPDGTIVRRSATTGSAGEYKDIYLPDLVGAWSVHASWLGNDEYKGSSNTATFTVVEPEFSINIGKTSLDLVIGESKQNVTITLESHHDFSSNVSLSISGVPSGASVNMYPTEVNLPPNGKASSLISFYASWDSAPGNYTVRLSASGGGKSRSQEIKLTIRLPPPRFTVLANPRIIIVPRVRGYNTTLTIMVSSLSNYTIVPSLKINNIPKGIEVRLNQEALRVQKLNSNSTTVAVSTSINPPEQGNYSILVECSYENVVAKELVTLVVTDRIPTILRVNLSSTSIQYGDTILINGSVLPQHPAKITISTILKNGTEIEMATFNTDEMGVFSQIMRIPLAPGEYTIRVLCEEDAFYSGSVSNLTLTVKKASIIITLGSNSTKAGSDEPVFLNGTAVTAKGEPVRDINVTLVVSGESGTMWVYAKTDENGKYEAVIRGLSPAKYDVVSLVSGDKYYESARSIPIKLEIQHPILRAINDILYPIVSLALIIFILITSIRVLVSTVHEIREERSYRANRLRDRGSPT
jgi:hypothetical protein